MLYPGGRYRVLEQAPVDICAQLPPQTSRTSEDEPQSKDGRGGRSLPRRNPPSAHPPPSTASLTPSPPLSGSASFPTPSSSPSGSALFPTPSQLPPRTVLSNTYPPPSTPSPTPSQRSYHRVRQVWERTIALFAPGTPIEKSPSFRGQIRNIFWKWMNIFLIVIPISWAFRFAIPEQCALVFVSSFLAIIPLTRLLGYATAQLSMRVGDELTGLVNATLGNAVGLIVAVVALMKCELRIVRSSLVGSTLSNLLLVLGLCFLAGGIRFSEQGFAVQANATQLDSSLLFLSVTGVLVPAAFDIVTRSGQVNGYDDNTEQWDIMKLSRAIAVMLLLVYFLYLYFQLFSHKGLYNDAIPAQPGTVQPTPRDGLTTTQEMRGVGGISRRSQAEGDPERQAEGAGELGAQREGPEPELSLWVAIALLVVVMIFVAVSAEWLVESIDGLTSGGSISKEFTGLILLPIISHGPEHVDTIMASAKGEKLALSMRVVVGGTIQIMLFIIPCIIGLGWINNKPITMLFDPFESMVLFFSVLTVNHIVQDGKSNWLSGMILICSYSIMAVGFWFYPGREPTGSFVCSA